MVLAQPDVLRRDSEAPPGVGPAGRSGSARDGQPQSLVRSDDVVVLLLVAMKAGSLNWGWWRVAMGAWPLRQVPGLRFAKALGSGFEGGFGLRPSTDRQGLFAVFSKEAEADAFLAASPVVAAYRSHAREMLSVKLRPTSARGSWSGFTPGLSAFAPASGPVAALTRASIKLSKASTFWSLAPASQASLETAAGCRLAVGLGEAPLLRQATFSIWEDVAAMDAYARSGAHMEAIRASQSGDFFTETMFVRFLPLKTQGVWKGVSYG